MKVTLGYAVFCRNLGLSSGRGVKTTKRGIHFEEVISHARVNLDCVVKILAWNHTNGIGYFRLSDSLIPYLYRTSGNAEDIKNRLRCDLQEVRKLAHELNTRLTFHFTNIRFIANEAVWNNHAVRLSRFATIANELDAKIECHLGHYSYGCDWLRRITANIESLPDYVRNVLTFENDSVWSPVDTLAVCDAVKVPFTYDITHHKLFASIRVSEPPTKFTQPDIVHYVSEARRTWEQYCDYPHNQRTTVHVSSLIKPNEDEHADFVSYEDYSKLRRALHDVGGDYYVVVEAKQLDNAVLQLQQQVRARRPYWMLQTTGGIVV